MSNGDACPICEKHAGRGPLGGQLVIRTPLFRVYHAPPDDRGLAPQGYLFIESTRHVPYLADLTDAEAAALGTLRTRLAAALRAETGASLVFAAVIGRGIAHFHEHLLCRYPETPADVPWDRSDEAGPHVDEASVSQLARGLAVRLEQAQEA